jgi:hypothetical protein
VAIRYLIALIASMAIGAQAAPIIFSSISYDTTAVAIAQGTADVHSANTPPTALPNTSSALVIGSSDFATSSALAASGLLTSFAESDSFGGSPLPFALGQSHLVGTIQGAGPLHLVLDFSSLSAGGGTGSLFVLLTNSISGTLFNDQITGNAVLQRLIPQGGVTMLDLLIVSEADGVLNQSVQNFAQVSIDASSTIPLPATPFLIVAGLAAMATARRKLATAAPV